MTRRKTIKGDDYVLVVLKVLEKDGFGRPSKCQVGYDDTTFKLEGGEEFVTAWMSAGAAEPQTKGNT